MSIIQQPYQVIGDFYDTYSLPDTVHILSSSLRKAQQEKMWDERSPTNLLYFFEKLEELLTASFSLQEDQNKRNDAKLKKDDKHWLLTGYENYCGWGGDADPWNCFPRHLTKKEFLDPWKALQKVTQYKSIEEWKVQLKDLLHHALSNNNMNNSITGDAVLSTWLLLHKLLEATHLIEVRAIKEDKDGPRPKWKKEKPGNKSSKEENEEEEPDDETHAWAVIKEYITFFGEHGTPEELWEMVKRSLTNEEDETSAHDRSNMIFVYEELKKLVDAVVILYKLRLKEQPQALLQEEKSK